MSRLGIIPHEAHEALYQRTRAGESYQAAADWLEKRHGVRVTRQAIAKLVARRRVPGQKLGRQPRPKCPTCGQAMPPATLTIEPAGAARETATEKPT